MNKVLLGAILLIGLAAGWLLSPATPGTAPGPLKEVQLERSSDGHFYVEALVNARTVRFLIDTGAGTVALTEEDARAAGLAVQPADYVALGEGPSGLVRGHFVTLGSLKVGEAERQDVKGAVVQGASVSLLGQPFLDQMDEIIIRKHVMILRFS